MSQSEEERMEMYTELVAKYSKAFYRRVHKLFELEDLAQEIWVTLFELEENGKADNF